MNLADCLREECIKIGSEATDKQSVLKEIAMIAKRDPALDGVPEDQVYQAFLERENADSTGLEKGIAIPHGRLSHISEFIVGIVTIPSGIDFDARDGKPTRIFIFLLGPEENRSGHIQLLSGIAQAMAEEHATEKLLAATSPAQLIGSFLFHTPEIEVDESDAKCMISIFLQKEEALTEVLQVLYSASSSIAVIEASEASSYLRNLPLFSTLWSDDHQAFFCIITAVASKGAVNRIAREIGKIFETEEMENGLVIVVQDIVYCSGSLAGK